MPKIEDLSCTVAFEHRMASCAEYHHPVAACGILHDRFSHFRREKAVRAEDRLNRRSLVVADLENDRTARLEHSPDMGGNPAIGVNPLLAAIQRHQRIVPTTIVTSTSGSPIVNRWNPT